MAPCLWAHRHRDQWDPVTNRLLMRVSPFSSLSTPPLCPPLTGMGMGAVGPSPSGLRVSSCGQRFLHSPPLFFQGASSPVPYGSNITATHLSFASPQHTLVLTPHLGVDPWPPAHQVASPCRCRSPLFSHITPSFQLPSSGSWAALVMHTGYRASTGTQVHQENPPTIIRDSAAIL